MRILAGLGTLCLLSALACSRDGKRDIRDYYFPVEELRSGKVYEYDVVQGDSSSPEYWYFRTFQRDTGLFLAGTHYDSRFRISQIIRQEIGKDGVFAHQYSLYDQDFETGKQVETNTVIDSAEIFPFRVRDSVGVFVFRMNYQPLADPGTTLYLTRQRIFLGEAPAFELDGATYPCIRFGLVESLGTKTRPEALLKARGEELYARGLGLVYYRKTFGSKSKFTVEYRLKDVFPMAELERKAELFFGN